jgi:hypothetical protein
MNVLEVYTKYRIPPNLQMHMLRVAAVGDLVSSHWNISGQVDVNLIINTLPIHDTTQLMLLKYQSMEIFN